MPVDPGGRSLALFNVDVRFYRIDNSCPQQSGPLGDGPLAGHRPRPRHGYRHDVRAGAHQRNPSRDVPCYPSRSRPEPSRWVACETLAAGDAVRLTRAGARALTADAATAAEVLIWETAGEPDGA